MCLMITDDIVDNDIILINNIYIYRMSRIVIIITILLLLKDII